MSLPLSGQEMIYLQNILPFEPLVIVTTGKYAGEDFDYPLYLTFIFLSLTDVIRQESFLPASFGWPELASAPRYAFFRLIIGGHAAKQAIFAPDISAYRFNHSSP